LRQVRKTAGLRLGRRWKPKRVPSRRDLIGSIGRTMPARAATARTPNSVVCYASDPVFPRCSPESSRVSARFLWRILGRRASGLWPTRSREARRACLLFQGTARKEMRRKNRDPPASTSYSALPWAATIRARQHPTATPSSRTCVTNHPPRTGENRSVSAQVVGFKNWELIYPRTFRPSRRARLGAARTKGPCFWIWKRRIASAR